MVFLFSAFCVYQYDIKKKKAYQVLSYRLLLLIAIGVAGCRCVVGGDTVRYMRYFEEYPSLFEVNIFSYALFDPLWLLLNSAIKIIWDDFFFFQFVHIFHVDSPSVYVVGVVVPGVVPSMLARLLLGEQHGWPSIRNEPPVGVVTTQTE